MMERRPRSFTLVSGRRINERWEKSLYHLELSVRSVSGVTHSILRLHAIDRGRDVDGVEERRLGDDLDQQSVPR
jgi:hypothetical protein